MSLPPDHPPPSDKPPDRDAQRDTRRDAQEDGENQSGATQGPGTAGENTVDEALGGADPR